MKNEIKIHCSYDELLHKTIRNKVKSLHQKSLDVVKIILNENEILINRKYLPLFSNFSWYVETGKGQTNYLRANVKYNGKKRTIFFHQLILGIYDDLEIDHFNGNGLDNRIENLRIVTHQENQNNQRKRKTKTSSKYIGVHFCKTQNKWVAMSTYKNKTKNIGRFENEVEAAIAYNNYLIKNKIKKPLNDIYEK